MLKASVFDILSKLSNDEPSQYLSVKVGTVSHLEGQMLHTLVNNKTITIERVLCYG